MKRYVIITCSVLAFLLFCSKSCETPEDENAAREEIAFKATMDSINHSFESDHLSEQTLRAFETKAKQKLADLADYLQISFDKSLDKSFKDQVGQMILDLFISDTVHIILRLSGELNEKNMAISDLLNIDPGITKDSLKIIFDSIELSEPLHRINNRNYTGSLRFFQRYKESTATNSGITSSVSKKVDIIATKIRKQFGTDTLKIWQVYLGDVR